jgi:transglutaminase-like putative cysteine protease
MPMDLEVIHETRYAYAAPVSLAHHLACLKPLDDAHQRRLGFGLDIDPPPAQRRDGNDSRGNACHWFSLTLPHDHLLVRAVSRVRLAPRFAALAADAGPAWDLLAGRLRYVALAPFDPAVEFVMPSPYVPRLEGLRRYAAPSLRAGATVAQAAVDLMRRIHADFRFVSDSTQVDTPLADVLTLKTGVCQDFAHLMIGALRMHGLPARYVSGYLLTRGADDGAPMVGADASHAWVQVYCPGTPGVPADGWLDLDPTNDVVPGLGHVRVAVGRDFGDVTPLRGVIRGGGRHALTVGVTTRVVGPVVARVPQGETMESRPP